MGLRDSGHCGRAGCRCTHTAGCDHGWLDDQPWTNPETGITYEQVSPCPICRPDAADRLAQQLRGESRNAP